MRDRSDGAPPVGRETQEATAFQETVASLERAGVVDPRETISPDLLATRAAMSRSEARREDSPKSRSLPRVIPSDEGDDKPDLEVLERIAEGGMGRIDLAVQRSFSREVALKRVKPDALCGRSVEALLREAEITGRLDHPNIVPVHLMGQSPKGDPLFVMKRIEGVAWSELIEDQNHPAWSAVDDRLARHVEILQQVCNAVEFAHRRGVVHRDLKPDNVMVGELGEVYVLDWGIAVRLGDEPTRDVAGTPSYMAPEMLKGSGEVTPRTDVYMLGAILHEVLTDEVRHQGSSLVEVLGSVAASEPILYPPHLPSDLTAICNRAMARDPKDRFESALAFRDALGAHLEHRGSMDLVREGEVKLEELREALTESTHESFANEAVRDDVRRLAAEADFAFRQALRMWPDNPDAVARRQEWHEEMFGLELVARNVPGARAHLAELDTPRPDLERTLETLVAQLTEEVRAREDLEKLGRERDFAVAAPTRIRLLITVHLFTLATTVTLGAMGYTLTTGTLFLVTTVGAVGYGVLAYRRRESLFATEANRLLQRSLALWIACGMIIPVVAWWSGISIDTTLTAVIALSTFAVFQIAIWTDGTMGIYALFWLPTAVLAFAWPGHGFFVVAMVSAMSIAAALVRLRLQRERADRLERVSESMRALPHRRRERAP